LAQKQTFRAVYATDDNQLMFDAEAIRKVVEITSTLDGVEYFQQQLHSMLEKRNQLQAYSTLLKEVSLMVDSARYQDQHRGTPWSGDTYRPYLPQSDFASFQQFLASMSAQSIQQQQITLDCALSDASEYKRAFSSDGELLDGESLDAMDTLYNAWLAEQQLISKGGVIYQGTEEGDIREDKQGNPIKANAERLRAMMMDDKRGFSAYVKTNNKDIQMIIHQHTYEQPQQSPE
jgi:hypothetical protein